MPGLDSNVKLLLTGKQDAGLVSDANTLLLLKMNAEPGLVDDSTTKLLIKPTGIIDGSQIFTDSSSSNKNVVAFGGVSLDEQSVAFNGMGISFDGSGDYLEIDNSNDFNYSNLTFAIESFIKLNSLSPDYNIYNHATDINRRIQITISGTSFRFFSISNLGTIDNTWTMPSVVANTWFHWAIERDISDNYDLYINGVVVAGGFNNALILRSNANNLKIGKADSFGVDFAGSISEYRITKGGTNRFGGAFTPPRIFPDKSSNAFDVIRGGVGSNSPKLDRTRSTFGTHSCDFDGSDAWLQIPDNAVWQFTDFTIEFWAAMDSTLAYSIYNQFEDSNNYTLFAVDINGNATLRVRSAGVNIIDNTWDLSGLGLTTFEWHFYELVRNGNDYDLYVDGDQIAGGFTDATAWPNIVGDVYIGESNGISGFSDFNGALDEYRISNNARHTASYTPVPRFTDGSLTPKTGILGEGQVLTDFRGDRIKFEDRGITFDGTNDAVVVPDSVDFFFDGDFTIDCWFRSITTSERIVCGQHADPSNYWSFSAGNTIRFRVRSAGVNIIDITFTGTPNPVANELNHIAIQREGNDYTCFVGGLQKGSTVVDATAHIDMPADFRVGELLDVIADLDGTIAELRISKGVARYSGNFTPLPIPYSVGTEFDEIVTESLGLADGEAGSLAINAIVTESLGLADPAEIPFVERSVDATETLGLLDTTNAQVSKSMQLEAKILFNEKVQLEAKIVTPPLDPPTDVLLSNMNNGDSVLACWIDPVSEELKGVNIFISTSEFGPFGTKINPLPITREFFIISGLAIDTYYIKVVSVSLRGASFDSILSLVSNDADLAKTTGNFRFVGPGGATIPAGANFTILLDDQLVGFVSDSGGTMTPTLDITMTSIKAGPQFIIEDIGGFVWISEDTLVTLTNTAPTTPGCIDNSGGPGTLITDDQETADVSGITIFTTLFRGNT